MIAVQDALYDKYDSKITTEYAFNGAGILEEVTSEILHDMCSGCEVLTDGIVDQRKSIEIVSYLLEGKINTTLLHVT